MSRARSRFDFVPQSAPVSREWENRDRARRPSIARCPNYPRGVGSSLWSFRPRPAPQAFARISNSENPKGRQMARNRTPLTKAKMTGADKTHPERFKGRNEPDGGGPLGEPPEYFNAVHRRIWDTFEVELPWLVRSDRAMVELACVTRAQIETGGEAVTASMMREHRQQLSSLGATPVTRSNVSEAPASQDEDDPFAQFMGGN